MAQALVAIVDPFSSGAMLAEALVARGVPCVAIESHPELPVGMRSGYRPALFVETLVHEEWSRTLAFLREHEPTHVMAGFESGVELAESLGEAIGLPTNDPKLRPARRDKYLMSEVAQRCGLATARQFCSSHPDELLEWVRGNLDWPVIAKPPKSVASDHVYCCWSLDDVNSAVTAILRDINVLGIRNHAAIVQEFLEGTEYVVDLVSVDARAKVTAVWRYERPADSAEFVCYDAMRLLDYEGVPQSSLTSFALEVVSALGIQFGPSHCELIWRNEQPVLVEIGARLSAGNNAALSAICGGISQLDETVKAILDPSAFLATMDSRPRLQQRAANVFLMPQRPGILVNTQHIETLRQLMTLHSMSVVTTPGEQLGRVAGRVTLVGRDEQAIDRDLATIRECQRAGIFCVLDDSVPG